MQERFSSKALHICVVVVFLGLVGCRPSPSDIRFTNPQPLKGKSLKTLPNILVGNYVLEDSLDVILDFNQKVNLKDTQIDTIDYSFSNILELKPDSITNLLSFRFDLSKSEFKNSELFINNELGNVILDLIPNSKYDCEVYSKEDTVNVQINIVSQLFSLEGNVIKKYKGQYFLNRFDSIKNGWQCFILKKINEYGIVKNPLSI